MIYKYAYTGNLESIWETHLDGFYDEGGTNEDGIETAPSSIFSKMVGEIPLLMAKFTTLPIALVTTIGKNLFGKIKEIFSIDNIKKAVTGIDTTAGFSNALECIKSGDISKLWEYSSADGDDNGFVAVLKILPTIPVKLVATLPTIISKAGHALWENVIDPIVNKVKETGSNIKQGFLDGFTNEMTGKKVQNVMEATDEEGNPLSGFQKVVLGIGRIAGGVFGLFTKAGNAIIDKVKFIATKVKNSVVTFGQTSLQYAKSSITGDPAGLWTQATIQADEENPVSGFTEALLFVQKLLWTPIAGVTWVGRKAIVEPIQKTIQFVKTTVDTIKTRSSSLMNYVHNGDPEGLWNDQMIDQEGNPVSGIAKGIDFGTRLVMYPMAQVTKIGNIIHEKFEAVKAVVVETLASVGQNQLQIQNLASQGDVEGLMSYEADVPDSPIAGIVKATTFGGKIINFMPAVVHMVGNKIHEAFEAIKAPIIENYEAYKTANEQIKGFADKGDISSIWNVEGDYGDGVLGGVFSGITIGTKLFNTLPGIVHMVSNGVKGLFNSFSTAITADVNALKSYNDTLQDYAEKGEVKKLQSLEFKGSGGILSGVFTFASHFLKVGAYLTGGVHWLGNKVKGLGEKAKETLAGSKLGKWLGFDNKEDASTQTANTNDNTKKKKGSGSGLALGQNASAANYSTGFQSQLDPRYKDISFANSTIGNAGCAPAVGTMVSATMGGSMDMNSAIDKARAYTNSNGTSAKYFEDTFNASPLKSTSTVKSALESGRPVILLGRDPSNNSKSKSPFGPDNHYVLAMGMKNGKVVVNDPESNGPRVYDQSILNKSSYNLTYGGSSNKRGKGFTDTENAQQIWAYLTSKLGFSEAGAAGLMGCWQNESSNNPNTIEGYYLSGYPGDDAVHTSEGLDNFTTNVLFPAYASSGISINKEAYKGSDGHYYPGFGLAQWTGPRGKALHDYESTSGKAWYTLDNQMQFIGNELQGTYAEYLSKAKSATDVNQATTDAYYDFEGGTRSDWLVQRKADAADIYNTYTGKSYNWQGGGDTASSSSSDSSSDNSSSSSDGSILSTLSSIFGSLSSIFDITNGFSLNSSGSSSSSSSSNSSGGVTNAKGAAAAAQAAENQLGYQESGDNITTFGDWSGCNGQPWCAAFSAWSIAQAFDGQNSSARKALYDCSNVNYCPTLVSTFKANNAWYDEPEVGDEVLYSKNGDDAYHVGLVTSVDKNAKTFVSVEGNTNDAVTKKEHSSYKDGNVYGFGRPDYTGATATVASNGNSDKGNTISGDADYSATGSGLRRGGSSGLLRQAAPSKFAYGSLKGQRFKFGGSSGLLTTKNRFSGAGSNLTKTVTKTLTNLKKNLTGGISNNGYTNNGSIDAELVENLLVSITSLLNSINNNTAPTQQIYDALKEYIDYVKGNKSSTSTDQVAMPTNSNEVDTNFANLVTTLAAIARG